MQSAKIPMIMENDTLHSESGREHTIERRCGTRSGEIVLTVEHTQISAMDKQSDFGADQVISLQQFGREGGTILFYEEYYNVES